MVSKIFSTLGSHQNDRSLSRKSNLTGSMMIKGGSFDFGMSPVAVKSQKDILMKKNRVQKRQAIKIKSNSKAKTQMRKKCK